MTSCNIRPTCTKLAIVPAAGGQPRILTTTLDRGVPRSVPLDGDGRNILFIVEDDRVTYVGPHAGRGRPCRQDDHRPPVVSSISRRDEGTFALLSATANEPAEVYALENGTLRRLTHQNDALLAELQLGTTEDFTSKSKDGTEVHGLMVKPASCTAGKAIRRSFTSTADRTGRMTFVHLRPPVLRRQRLRGLSVNYRGSSGRGSAFQKAIFADWGNKEVLDLLGAVDHASRRGVADPDRLGIGGWSYGGILTDYTIATDPRFKAAVSGASSALQLTMYGPDQYIMQYENGAGPAVEGQGPVAQGVVSLLPGRPDQDADAVHGGDKDFNVPLDRRRADVPGAQEPGRRDPADHLPRPVPRHHVPSYLRDRLERYLAWYDKYLRTP